MEMLVFCLVKFFTAKSGKSWAHFQTKLINRVDFSHFVKESFAQTQTHVQITTTSGLCGSVSFEDTKVARERENAAKKYRVNFGGQKTKRTQIQAKVRQKRKEEPIGKSRKWGGNGFELDDEISHKELPTKEMIVCPVGACGGDDGSEQKQEQF